ncbi:MAG: hypothetical protein IKY64_09935 [Bacteroidaceae bacterium]|nr:hypothetical protein [Bacteroidaceae bacterium]
MKKFFRMLLLAAVALMPVMGMAQDNSERDYAWEQQMRSQQYADSVKAAQQDAEYRQELTLASMRNDSRHLMLSTFMNQQIWIPTAFFGCIIGIVVLCLRHSRKKAEDQKELINKLIDNNLLNSTETISKETIEALMNPNSKKSEKERFITDATLLGLGLGLLFGATSLHGDAEDLLIFVGMTLAGLGLLRLIIRTITTIIERKNAKNKMTEEPKVVEAEIVEEK